MKDGRILIEEKGSFLAEYSAKFERVKEPNTAVFIEKAAFSRIIDPNNIAGLLFENPGYQGELMSGEDTFAFISVILD